MKTIKRLSMLAISCSLFVGCYWPETSQETTREEPIKVKAITLKKEPYNETKVYHGELQFSKSASFVAQQPGIVTKLNARPGQKVRRGEVVAVYPPLNHQLQIDQARIEQNKIAQDYTRQQELFKAGAVSKVSVDTYKTQLDVLVKTTQQLQNMNTIRAPFSGIITQVPVKIGEEVGMGQALFSMAETATVEVNFYVTPHDIAHIAIGTTTYLTLSHKKIEGKITKTSIQMDSKRKAFLVTASFKNEGVSFTGTHVEIELETGPSLSGIWIPVESLKQIGNRHYVFIIKDDKAIETDVKIGQRNETSVQITEGLEVGQRLITAGSEKVERNSQVLTIQ
ncbi:efflux RND transporter periplasmic adaptor subunit [Allomuricauda sp. SCSIO 65647]|uniref:efflux RND transporter periplasmic adaptor subunit n=1 Tax=Allomuricauda sp. SCSIO 65647 TaxID=2908843 RepID=UPI001F2921A3|nr:efflux RND transporter periplasmic adaptor subunit [Muricauda sp. SCSIO 65647]UJH68746.1 efflux RND transporter periplasmic adaptor subunit [Muricauda sp. SCSIO 65647]